MCHNFHKSYFNHSNFISSEDLMINNNFISPDRSNKIMPSSPQARRKHPDFPNPTIQPLPNIIDQRKDPLSPQHYYPQKIQNGKPLDASIQKEYSLDAAVQQLNIRMARINQKLGQHEAILIKITENSIQNNKQECKKSGKGDRQVDILAEALNKLRRDFEDYKAGNIATREIQVKNQLFSELIHKSEQRMRQEMHTLRELVHITNTQSQGKKGDNAILSDERIEEIDRTIRKLEKNVSLNTNKIFGAYEKIDSLSSSLDGHMQLINAELNKNINKIITFVNQKVSKPLNQSISKMTQIAERVDKLEKEAKLSHFGGMKASVKKSDKQVTLAEYRETLTAFNQEIIISEKMYFIDIDGYLLDQEYYYLLDKNQEKIRLDESQIKMLRTSNIIS